MGYIYLITNKINGKKYVGQTIRDDINIRWNQHKKVDKHSLGNYIYNAYVKYGIDNFKFQIVCICFDEDCNNYEEFYIKKYNTISPNGYNLKEGGNNSHHHPETKKKLSEKLKGRKLTKEQIEKLREKMKGKKHSEETKNKIREKLKSLDVKHSEEYKQNMSIIVKKALNERKLNGYEQNIKSLKNLKEATEKRRRKVAQYSKENILIKEFNSISEAEKYTNIDNRRISEACNYKSKTAGGFIWKFI